MSTLFVMDKSGDTRLQWNVKDVNQVEAARKRFNELKAKNYLAYTVDDSGQQGEVLESFNPKLERIIMAPQMVGG